MRDLYEVVLHLVDENKRLQEKVGRLTVQQRRTWSLEEALGAAERRHDGAIAAGVHPLLLLLARCLEAARRSSSLRGFGLTGH